MIPIIKSAKTCKKSFLTSGLNVLTHCFLIQNMLFFSSLICTFAFAIFSSQNILTQIFNLDKFLPYKLSWDGFMDGVCIGPNSSNCIH